MIARHADAVLCGTSAGTIPRGLGGSPTVLKLFDEPFSIGRMAVFEKHLFKF
jgi:hypothetical protein